MYSFSLKFSFYTCNKFPEKGQALSFIGRLHPIVKDLLRLSPKMEGCGKKEGREKREKASEQRDRGLQRQTPQMPLDPVLL